MKIKFAFILFLTFAIGERVKAQQGFPFDNEIREFKHQDSLKFPAPNGILFIGSSSIRLWDDLEQRFAGEPVIKRGVGGSELWQLVDYYTPYILFPYHPRKIFIYAGENDIAGGKDSKFVFLEFQKLYEMIGKRLPDAAIYYMSIKPSPSRLKFMAENAKANELIKNYLANKPNTTFIDLGSTLLKGNTAMPDSSLYKPDYLHLNSKGYDRWQQILEPFVK